ncbi:MAG: cell division protein FtsA [Pseudomonadota bacterium]
MQKKLDIIVGVDIGTTKVVAVVAEISGSGIEYIGVGSHPCKGLQKGMVVNIDNTANAIKQAVGQASQQAGCHISCIYVTVCGQTTSRNSTGMVTVRGNEVEMDDIDRVLEAASSVTLPNDQRVIHILPQEFIVNGQDGIKNPVGMCGVRLETKVHLITAGTANLQNLAKCVKRSGLEIEAFVHDHLAGSIATLQDDEKELGVAFVDIGGGTTNIIIYIDDSVMYTTTLPIGSTHITRDIAVGLRTPMSSAESIKQKHGNALVDNVDEDETIEIPMVGGRPESEISRKALCQIIQPRVEQIIDFIYRALQQSTLLPALASGVVIAGGGSILPGVPELAHEILDLPVRRGRPYGLGGMSNVLESPQYAASVGIIKYASEDSGPLWGLPETDMKKGARSGAGGSGGKRSVWSAVGDWIKEIM